MDYEDLHNITYRQQRYRGRDLVPKGEEIEPQPERDKGKETMGGEDKAAFNNLISALYDLARGQKEVLATINKLADKPGESQNNVSSNGEGGSNNGNKIHARTAMQSHLHLYRKTNRPTIPRFFDSPTTGQVV